MSEFTVYSVDTNSNVEYTNAGRDGPPDWIDDLARKNGRTIDLTVDTRRGVAAWQFQAKNPGSTTHANRFTSYFGVYREAGVGPSNAVQLLDGLETQLERLRDDRGWEFLTAPEESPGFVDHPRGYEFHRDPVRWQAGFDLPGLRMDPLETSLTGHGPWPTLDILSVAIEESDDRLFLGMASYLDALRVLKGVVQAGVDASVAINTDLDSGATEEIDLLLWPGAETNFQPMDEATRDVLADFNFYRGNAPEIVTTDQDYDPEPEPPDVPEFVGRIGLGLVIFVGGLSAWSLAGSSLVHPLSGLGAFAGLVATTIGVFGVDWLDRHVGRLTGGSASDRSEGNEATETTEQPDPPDEDVDDSNEGHDASHGSEEHSPDESGDSDPDDGTGSATSNSRREIFKTRHWRWKHFATFIGYTLLGGFLFRTVFRLLDWWPDGAVPAKLLPTLIKGAVYTEALVIVGVVLYLARSGFDIESVDPRFIGQFVIVWGSTFLLGLLLGPGLACQAWYEVIGFAGRC